MKKIIWFAVISVFIVAVAAAQNDPEQKGAPFRDGTCKPSKYKFCPKNVLYHETTSNFSYLTYNSINWEGTLVCKPKFMWTLRLGGIYYNFVKLRLAGAPVGFNFLFGGGDWLWDAGFGGTYLYIYKNYDASLVEPRFSDNIHMVGVNLHVGLRYEIQKTVFFKLVIDPMYVLMGKEDIPLMKNAFQPMVGLGIGYTFNK
jgi:hypothetical protein